VAQHIIVMRYAAVTFIAFTRMHVDMFTGRCRRPPPSRFAFPRAAASFLHYVSRYAAFAISRPYATVTADFFTIRHYHVTIRCRRSHHQLMLKRAAAVIFAAAATLPADASAMPPAFIFAFIEATDFSADAAAASAFRAADTMPPR
jgi:hypothetical protein